MSKTNRSAKAAFALAGAAFLAFGTAAQAARYETEYTVSYAGLPVAKSQFTTKTNGNRYAVTGRVSSAGIGAILSSTSGTAAITGLIGNNNVVPTSYRLNYTYGNKQKSTVIGYGGGRVSKTVNTPEPPKRANWVPVKDGHLVGAVDPLSAWMIVTDSPSSVCNRTIRFYDGELRANLVLSPAGSQPFITKGFNGNAVRCNGKIVPISGYRKGHKAIDEMRAASFEIGFARLDSSNFYAPVIAKVRTAIGTVSLRATRMEKVAD